MIRLVDVVNFNADGSCLAAGDWLAALAGGRASRVYRWLDHYAAVGKPVTLGLVGGTLADMVAYNPEAVELIDRHPETFELVLRPFSHDVALLRTAAGFALNFELGRRILEQRFTTVAPWYLPPEFMLNNHQVKALADWGVEGTFVNPDRFKPEVQARLPTAPYRVTGVLGAELRCVPFRGALADAYLDSLHGWSAAPWNDALAGLAAASPDATVYSWRDGESFLLLPEGQRREARWLDEESPQVVRVSLATAAAGEEWVDPTELSPPGYRSYPVHSFASWFREFRMLGYLERVQQIEQRLDTLSDAERILFLQTINSDVLSSVEKDSPVIELWSDGPDGAERTASDHTLLRSARSYEGEDYLAILDGWSDDGEAVRSYIAEGDAPHLRKLRARLGYFDAL